MSEPNERRIHLDAGAATTALVYPASGGLAHATLILGHGAGAGQRSAFMVEYARALAALGLDIVTFNFPYTEQGRRMPDRAPVLEACYRAVIEDARSAIEKRTARPLHRRQVDGRPHGDARRGRGRGAATRRPRAPRVSAASARAAGRTTRQASAGDPSSDVVRPGRAATRSARPREIAPIPRRSDSHADASFTSSPRAITRSSLAKRDPAAQAAVHDELATDDRGLDSQPLTLRGPGLQLHTTSPACEKPKARVQRDAAAGGPEDDAIDAMRARTTRSRFRRAACRCRLVRTALRYKLDDRYACCSGFGDRDWEFC